MITKYIAYKRDWGKLIEPIKAQKETENSVWIDGRRRVKRSDYANYFDTFDEAKAFLTEYAESKLAGVRRELELARSYAGNVKGLKDI